MKIEKYDATVMTNEDPEQRGRIKIACAGLLGDEETELPEWVEPNLQWGWFVIPEPGEIVEIETREGNDQDEIFGQSSMENLEIRWSGKRSWTGDEVDNGEVRSINDEFKENYGKRRGFATPAGHLFIFDDTGGSEKIFLTWTQGDKSQTIELNETGSIKISNSDSSVVHLDAENEKIEITDKHNNVVRMSADLIETEGTEITLKNTTVNLLDGTVEPILKGTATKTAYDAHTHPTAFGPSGPPVVLLPSNALSQNANVGG